MTSDGTAIPVLALDKITFSEAGTIYNLRLVNETINKHHYYPISEGTIAVYDCSGNSNHITITGSTVQEWTANKQDEFHYNLKKRRRTCRQFRTVKQSNNDWNVYRW